MKTVKTVKTVKAVKTSSALRGVFVHVSATHDGYNSAFRYCFLPGKKKSALDLDKSPYLSKEHPVPKDACKFVQTSSAITASGAEAVRAECSGARMPPNVPHVINSMLQ